MRLIKLGNSLRVFFQEKWDKNFPRDVRDITRKGKYHYSK